MYYDVRENVVLLFQVFETRLISVFALENSLYYLDSCIAGALPVGYQQNLIRSLYDFFKLNKINKRENMFFLKKLKESIFSYHI